MLQLVKSAVGRFVHYFLLPFTPVFNYASSKFQIGFVFFGGQRWWWSVGWVFLGLVCPLLHTENFNWVFIQVMSGITSPDNLVSKKYGSSLTKIIDFFKYTNVCTNSSQIYYLEQVI